MAAGLLGTSSLAIPFFLNGLIKSEDNVILIAIFLSVAIFVFGLSIVMCAAFAVRAILESADRSNVSGGE